MSPNTREVAIRSMIVAPKDHVLLSFDLSQAESWIVAYAAKELHMQDYLKNSDIHLETACVLFDKSKEDMVMIKETEPTSYKRMRYTGKRYNHASAYRMGYLRAAQVINSDSDKPPYVVVTNSESKEFSQKWIAHYILKPWWDEIEWTLDHKNRTIITPYGRIRTFFGQWGPELFKEATAHIPQSTVADHFNGAVCKEYPVVGGLLEIRRRYVIEANTIRIINQSHDSFMCEVHKSCVNELIEPLARLLYRPLVIHGEEFRIPVDCEMGERWGELKKVPLSFLKNN